MTMLENETDEALELLCSLSPQPRTTADLMDELNCSQASLFDRLHGLRGRGWVIELVGDAMWINRRCWIRAKRTAEAYFKATRTE